MLRENSIQRRLDAAAFMAMHGTEKKIVMSYCGSMKGLTEAQFMQDLGSKKKHRDGTHWLRGDDAYLADRAIRMMIRVLGENSIDRPLTATEFHAVCKAYFAKYPQDSEMSTNRFHYLIQSIRGGEVVLHKSCSSCGETYVTHRAMAHLTKCVTCRD